MNEFTDNPLTHGAFRYAKAAHERVGQMRKFGPVQRPYIIHPVQVATYVQGSQHNDPVTVAVALLHDVLEDTLREGQTVPDGATEMFEHFKEVTGDADLAMAVVAKVMQVTDKAVPSDGNRAARMAINCTHAGKADPEQQTVKLADIKSNMPSICKYNPGFARKWVEEKAKVHALLTAGDPALYSEVGHMIQSWNLKLFNPDNYEIV